MKSKEVIQEVRKALGNTKQAGETSVSIEAMDNFMAQLEKRAEQVGEFNKLEHERLLKEFEANNARNIAASQNMTSHRSEEHIVDNQQAVIGVSVLYDIVQAMHLDLLALLISANAIVRGGTHGDMVRLDLLEIEIFLDRNPYRSTATPYADNKLWSKTALINLRR